MVFRYLTRPAGSSTRAFDADTLSWQSAVVANGGSVSLARLVIVDQFVFDEKASGAWALTDDYWGLWAENATQALTSLKQRRLATAVNAPAFTADRGYAFDGATNYLNTGFIPSTHAVAMTGSDMRIGVYQRTNLASTTVAAGTTDGGSQSLYIRTRTGADVISGALNTPSATFASSITDGRGLTVISRTAAPVFETFKNGVTLGTVSPTPASVIPTRSVYIGCVNSVGTAGGFHGASIGLVAVGASLSATQELAQYNNIQAFATAVGAQV